MNAPNVARVPDGDLVGAAPRVSESAPRLDRMRATFLADGVAFSTIGVGRAGSAWINAAQKAGAVIGDAENWGFAVLTIGTQLNDEPWCWSRCS